MLILKRKKNVIAASFILLFAVLPAFLIVSDAELKKVKELASLTYLKEAISQIVNEKLSVLGFSVETPTLFFPHFPQRLLYVAAEISAVSEELAVLNEELLESTKGCDCKFAESQCEQVMAKGYRTACKPGPIKVFGESCRTKDEINEKQTEINDLNMDLSFLQELLKTEMETSLERQLKTLREDDAKALKENLEKLLALSPKILEPSQNNLALPDDCDINKCEPNCELEGSFELKACLIFGQQKHTEVKFKAGVGLDDLKLGEVKVKNINLSLPEEIKMPAPPKLPGLTIRVPSITLTCPTEKQGFTFRSPSPALPDSPTIKLSCPKYPSYSSYQCAVSPEEESKSFVNVEWYFQTFSWLSEKCQELPGMKDSRGMPIEKELKKCFDKESVHQTIIQGCDAFWSRYGNWGSYLAPSICKLIGKPCLEKEEAKARECKNIFTKEGESAPSSCKLDTQCSIWMQSCGGTEACYATGDSVKKIIETLEKKCEQLKQGGRETIPEPCKFLPLFTGKFPEPEALNYSGAEKSCPDQKMGDYPDPVPGCAFAFPSVPKISFPKIIVPDIRLPSFSFPPFFRVKLPNFIFEDLILPDLDLCNLSDCQFQFPDLSFKIPSLRIPTVEVPPSQVPGFPEMEVKVAPIEFRPLSFQLPQIINLGSLATPELQMPKMPLPQPRFQFSFNGINIDLTNLLLGLFQIPSLPGGCISIDKKFTPLIIDYPDVYKYWPAFPRIPNIPFCQDVREFCKDTKGSIKEVSDKANEIQKKVDAILQSEIQNKLDTAAKNIQQEMQSEIKGQLDEIAKKIGEKAQKHIEKYDPGVITPSSPEAVPIPGVWMVERGKLPCEKIPPLKIDGLEDIAINPKPISNFIDDLWPDKISIDWPDSLKKIDLREGSLRTCAGSPDCQAGERCDDGECIKKTGSGIACAKDKDCKKQDEKCYEDAGKKRCWKFLGYKLPDVPLSKLGYSEEHTERLPGLQMPSININLLENAAACQNKPPKGGNPCPTGKIQSNLDKIKETNKELQKISQNLIDILY